MNKRRLEQDKTGDYGTDAVGYNVYEPSDLYFCKQDFENARRVFLKIEKQAVVN